jgi:heme exporter protein D
MKDFRALGTTVVSSVAGVLHACGRRKQLLTRVEVHSIRQASILRSAAALAHDLSHSPADEILLKRGAECIRHAVAIGRLPPDLLRDRTPEGIMAGLGVLIYAEG